MTDHATFLQTLQASPEFWEEVIDFYYRKPDFNFSYFFLSGAIMAFKDLPESFQLSALVDNFDSKGVKISPCPLRDGWVVCIRQGKAESSWPIPS